jgi:hypothetical protein
MNDDLSIMVKGMEWSLIRLIGSDNYQIVKIVSI